MEGLQIEAFKVEVAPEVMKEFRRLLMAEGLTQGNVFIGRIPVAPDSLYVAWYLTREGHVAINVPKEWFADAEVVRQVALELIGKWRQHSA